MENDIHKRVRGWIKDEVKYYICFCRAALALTAAVFCHNLVNYNVFSVLVTYVTDTLNKDSIRRAAIVVNVQQGLQTMVKAWAYARRSHFRKIIIISTAALILGLLMLYLSASNPNPNTSFVRFIFNVSVPIAVGKAGGVSFLVTYLLDEFIAGHENISDINYNRAQWRTKIWLLAAGVFMFLASFRLDQSWSRMFLYSMYMILAACFFSLLGSWLSHQRHHPNTKTESMEKHGQRKNDHETLPPDQPRRNDGSQLPESSPTAGAEAQQKSSSLCSVKQENVAKLPLRMIPMWSSFIVFGLVTSTAETFFIMQDDNMHADVTTALFLIAKDVLKQVVAHLCKFLVASRIPRNQQNLALKIIIFLGMIFSILCPCLAWRVEVQRLKIAHEWGLLDMSKDTKVPMSDWRLAPQFCLWGLMEGFALSGLDEFFNYHVSKSEDYGSEVYNTIPIGIGSFLSVVCVLACEGWFGNTLNQSRLDNYLWMITVVAWINLCWFFFVSTFYSTKEEVADEGINLQELTVVEVSLDIS